MKKIIGLLIVTLLVTTGCSVSLKSDAPDKIKDDIVNKVADDVAGKVSDGLQEGVEEGVEMAKDEVVAQLTAKEVVISSNEISPSEISVVEGDEVKLKVSSGDSKTHGFYLPDYNISETVEENETEIITFKADKKGSFTYSCNLNCDGIVSGTLIVH